MLKAVSTDWATSRGEPTLQYKQIENKAWYYSSCQSHVSAAGGSQDPVPGADTFSIRVIPAYPNTLLLGLEWVRAGSSRKDLENLERRCQFNLCSGFWKHFNFKRNPPKKAGPSQGWTFLLWHLLSWIGAHRGGQQHRDLHRNPPKSHQPLPPPASYFWLHMVTCRDAESCFCGQTLSQNVHAESKQAFPWKIFQTSLLTRKKRNTPNW